MRHTSQNHKEVESVVIIVEVDNACQDLVPHPTGSGDLVCSPATGRTRQNAKNVIQREDRSLASFSKVVSSLCHLSVPHIPLSADSFLIRLMLA